MTTAPEMKMNRLAPWFGADLAVCEEAARRLGRLAWAGIPFCAGLSIIPHIQTTYGVAGDLHRHIINLAKVVQDEAMCEQLVERLDGVLFHPDEMLAAQKRLMRREEEERPGLFSAELFGSRPPNMVESAADYYIACWMGRGGHAGKKTEFTQNLSVRWKRSGGDSAKRWRSAIESLRAWRKALHTWSFICEDVFVFLESVEDAPNNGLYIDPPWPKLGDEYKHTVSPAKQTALRDRLERFEKIRIVVRFGEDPLIRELYRKWEWIAQSSRNQQNNEVEEFLIVRRAA